MAAMLKAATRSEVECIMTRGSLARVFRREARPWPEGPHAKAQPNLFRLGTWGAVTIAALQSAQELRIELPHGVAKHQSKADPE